MGSGHRQRRSVLVAACAASTIAQVVSDVSSVSTAAKNLSNATSSKCS